MGPIVVTGPPGVGKTTLIRKVCENLVNKHHVVCNGFYTEEVRNNVDNRRIGFDIITLNKKRGKLSRECHNGRGPFVGKYCVFVKDFEDIALPLINPCSNQDVLVIDEVGKMELKSKKFEMCVENCIMKTNVLLTVPYDSRQPLHLVDKIKTHPKAQVFVVTKENRNHLQDEVTKHILNLVKKS